MRKLDAATEALVRVRRYLPVRRRQGLDLHRVAWGTAIFTTAGAAGLLLALWWQRRVANEAPWRLSLSYGELELRDYEAHLEVHTDVRGDLSASTREGFRRLTDYLFGRSTVPVQGHRYEMTVPVSLARAPGGWRVALPVPYGEPGNEPAAPADARVLLGEQRPRRMAALRFNGRVTERVLSQRTRELLRLIDLRGRKVVGEPVLALYDPPWRLPRLRRNEILVELEA